MCIPASELNSVRGAGPRLRARPRNFENLYDTYVVKVRQYFTSHQFGDVPPQNVHNRLARAHGRYVALLDTAYGLYNRDGEVNGRREEDEEGDDEQAYQELERVFAETWRMMRTDIEERTRIMRCTHNAIVSYARPVVSLSSVRLGD